MVDPRGLVLAHSGSGAGLAFQCLDPHQRREAEAVGRTDALDLQKNKDALKISRFGSTLSRELNPSHCPTCEQPIDQSLLSQGALETFMSIEENV